MAEQYHHQQLPPEQQPRLLQNWNKQYTVDDAKFRLLFFTVGSWALIIFNIIICGIVIKEIYTSYNPIYYFTAASTFVGSIGALALIYTYVLGDKK